MSLSDIGVNCWIFPYPADTWRNNNVLITPKRDVVLTLLGRYYYVTCPLADGGYRHATYIKQLWRLQITYHPAHHPHTVTKIPSM